MLKNLAQMIDSSHKDIQTWFLYHQECLLLNEDAFAKQSFAIFSEYLQAHLSFETEQLYPYLESEAVALNWPVSVYNKEHEKLLKLLKNLADMLADYFKMEKRRKRIALLEVLDKQSSFAKVLEHHEEREDKDLLLAIKTMALPELSLAWQAINQNLLQQSQTFRLQLESYLAS